MSRFAAACGATSPLDLRVDLVEGGVLAEGSVTMPFSLIGRDDACDVTLADAEVNPRHAWLQAIGGRVFAVDLGSRAGLGWPDGQTGSGWLDVGVPVRVGPFQVRLRSPASPHPALFLPGANPLQSDSLLLRSRPTVALEFRNGKRAKDQWVVNRLITLIGRAPECKINLTGEDIVGYHCGLVLTPDGLWVVDLSGRGVVVNGERMRVSPLRHGAELWVGRFLIGVHYPAAALTPPPTKPGNLTSPTPMPALQASPVSSEPAEDEVPLGVVPPSDPVTGLPSSHIMADAFRLWGGNSGVGPVSNPILVTGSGPTPPTIPVPPAATHTRPPPPPMLELFTGSPSGRVSPSSEPPAEAVVGPLLRQLGELHAQMFAQFQQSLVLMVRLFACLRREQLPAMQRELARIQELNSELAQLQGEVARRATEEIASPPRPATPRIASNSDATGLHEWVVDRINSLQVERQARWQSLVGMFGGKSA